MDPRPSWNCYKDFEMSITIVSKQSFNIPLGFVLVCTLPQPWYQSRPLSHSQPHQQLACCCFHASSSCMPALDLSFYSVFLMSFSCSRMPWASSLHSSPLHPFVHLVSDFNTKFFLCTMANISTFHCISHRSGEPLLFNHSKRSSVWISYQVILIQPTYVFPVQYFPYI